MSTRNISWALNDSLVISLSSLDFQILSWQMLMQLQWTSLSYCWEFLSEPFYRNRDHLFKIHLSWESILSVGTWNSGFVLKGCKCLFTESFRTGHLGGLPVFLSNILKINQCALLLLHSMLCVSMFLSLELSLTTNSKRWNFSCF